ncbi:MULTISPECIES: DUF3375 domain-containing protein [Microbacterium]|uniref:DUF3375 domain-containing protein n=1 Tax=Microbacterium TaxID=33882 RepID=UPI001EF49820|nr:DUF3375 domain-containing protein [Microbacterium aurum]MCG7413463.1 DUF3375 domain-containing protein [Microbacterium aurum]
MSVLSTALAVRRLIEENPMLTMLRADRLPIIAATLGEHLGSPGARMPADDLHELIDADLEVLRDHFDLGEKNAKHFCADWRATGILRRRPASSARGETYELEAAAYDALRILGELEAPRSTVTESRLVSLATALHQLAIDTDPDANTRLVALKAQRDQIDADIRRIEGGDVEPLDERRARERVEDALMLAQDLPADFARVRARFEQINHDLRASILNTDGSQSAVLDDVFRGVDLIEQSDEGRTFSGFSGLLTDPERYARLDADIAAILDRDFAVDLEPTTRRALRTLLPDMKSASREVQSVLTEFARGLRRYVHSQEFQRDRALRNLIHEALAAGLTARQKIKPYAEVGLEQEISAMRMSSGAEVVAHDPSEYDTGAALGDAEPGTIDFAALAAIARESEIDFAELVGSVNETLDALGPATVGAVLDRHPATQGLASVLGLFSLATRQGRVDETHLEEVAWLGPHGLLRRASVPRHEFTGRVEL